MKSEISIGCKLFYGEPKALSHYLYHTLLPARGHLLCTSRIRRQKDHYSTGELAKKKIKSSFCQWSTL